MTDSTSPLVELLRARTADLAASVVDRHWKREPRLADRYGPEGHERCLEDAAYHLQYLTEAVEADSPILFADYIGWARVVLDGRNVPASDLKTNLECLREALEEQLPTEYQPLLASYLLRGLDQLSEDGDTSESETSESELAGQYLAALLEGNRAQAIRVIMDAVEAGTSVEEIYLHVLQPVQYEVGRLWQTNRLSVAREHYCTAVTQMVMSQLYPRIISSERASRAMICACIGSDLHEIGARMIADFFEMNGWDTHYCGASTPISGIVEMVERHQAQALALSATMTYHLPILRRTIAAVRSRRDTFILVGGRPFNLDPELWKHVGADAWAPDARRAVEVVTEHAASGRLS